MKFSPRRPAVTPGVTSGGTSGVKRWVTLGATALVSAIWAGVLVTVLNYSTFAGDPRGGHLLLALRAHTLLVSTAFVWVLLLGMIAFTGRLWLSLGIGTVVAGTLAATNATKLQIRGDPLQPSDLAFVDQTGFLTEMVGLRPLILALVGAVVAILASVFLGRLVSRYLPPMRRGLDARGRRLLVAGRVLMVLATCAAVFVGGNFHDARNPVRAAFDANGAMWKPWKQRSNYRANGFVAGTLFNTGLDAMSRPTGYSKSAMADIAARYSAVASLKNLGRTGSLDDVNVVLVLSESFSQPLWLRSIEWPQDPIPNTTALMKRTLSGRMLAPGFGGGTANVEFELLTGQSMSQFSPQVQVAYDQVVPKHPGYPSFVRALTDGGHRAVAIHPYKFSMYRRTEVLPDLGFDRMVDETEIQGRQRIERSRFVSDQSVYAEVTHSLEESSDPLLVHLITMQNHLPYGRSYTDPITPTSGLPPGAAERAGQYARGINSSDAALPGFLDSLRKSKEKTVVVFYGDHLPGEIYPVAVQDREGARTMHQTPWFMWSNFARLAPRQLPTVSPNQLMPLLLDAVRAPLTPYQALLSQVRAVVPGMEAGMLIGADDKVASRRELTDRQRDLLRDYRMVQYDFSVGRRHAVRAMMQVPPPPTPPPTSPPTQEPSAPETSAPVKP